MGEPLDVPALAALCDVFVPALRPPTAATGDPHGFFGLTASSAGTVERVAQLLPTLLDPVALGDLDRLLAVVRRVRLGSLPRPAADRLLRVLAATDADAGAGLRALRSVTLAVHYGAAGPDGRNPTWPQLGYPGPPSVEPPPGGRLPVTAPPVDRRVADRWLLEADAVVVGSGAGGGVVAARLAAAGLDVLVLEAGGDLQEEDFPGDELSALRSMYWRSGLVATADEHVAILAGTTLGGGTTVNWSNWVAPPAHVRRAWAQEHGLDGVDGDDFDAEIAAVTARVGATDATTTLNGPNQRLLDGAGALGWAAHRTTRNVDGTVEHDVATGHTGYGDRSGAKQGTLRTWLRDAVADGARVVTGCHVDRVRHRRGRAVGVEGRWTTPEGRELAVVVTAPVVVVAAGALETPALLLRSGVGGPSVGHHLRLHPVPAVVGMYDEPLDGWRGPPQGVVVDEFASSFAGHGYLIESAQWHPGLTAALVRWPSARDAKLLMGRFGRFAPFLAIVRDHGSGTVTVDGDGRPVVRYPVDDHLDQQVLRRAVHHLVELHAAAGARAIVDAVAPGRRTWRRGTPVSPFADSCASAPLGSSGRRLLSAHQMGTARMGVDRSTSVADPDGQLRDVAGVWIGDSSAFPTAVGSNPMCTVMALASRTAGRILAAR